MANKVYTILETAMVWSSAGSASDSANPALFSPTSLASAAGRQAQHHNFGVAAIGRRFAVRAWAKTSATSVIGETVEVYLKTSDGTHPDNDDGTADAAVGTVDRKSVV